MPSAAQLSRVRTQVVPTATTRPFRLRVSITALAVAAPSSNASLWIGCCTGLSTRTGAKVSSPTCRVTNATSTPASRTAESNSEVKWRPAVGAAADPSRLA